MMLDDGGSAGIVQAARGGLVTDPTGHSGHRIARRVTGFG